MSAHPLDSPGPLVVSWSWALPCSARDLEDLCYLRRGRRCCCEGAARDPP